MMIYQDQTDVGALPRFSDREYKRRYELALQMMKEEGLEVLVIYGSGSSRDDIWYLTNFPPRHDCYLVLGREGSPTLLVQILNHVPQAEALSTVADTRWGGADSALAVAEALRDRASQGAIGLVGGVPYQHYQTWQEALAGRVLRDVTQRYRGLRLVKSQEEIEWLRRGAEFSDQAMAALAEKAAPGVTEYELVAAIEAAYTAQGGLHGIRFLTSTSMSHPHAYVPAQNPSGRRLQRGDVVVTEISAGCWGYSGQILRSFTVAEPPRPQYQSLYEIAMEAYERVAEVIRPGVDCEAVLEAAEVIHRSGYTICDDLVHGYGMGYLPPVLRTRQTSHKPLPPLTFQENMALVIQPNPTAPDRRMGVQVGNLVVVTRDGVETLQKFPMDFRVCG